MPRDDFTAKIKTIVAKRVAYICSNPSCKKLCIGPSETFSDQTNYFGKVAHITAAAQGGPRYNASLTSEERKSAENAIFLCANCADMIDKNKGVDYSNELLLTWKSDHEELIKQEQAARSSDTISSSSISNDNEFNQDLLNDFNQHFTRLLETNNVSGALEIRLTIHPVNNTEVFFERAQFLKVKRQITSNYYGPIFIHTEFNNLFTDLKIDRKGIKSIQNIEEFSYSCILISNNGTIHYQFNDFDLLDPYHPNRLNIYYLSGILLGLFDFIYTFYSIFYENSLDIKVIFTAEHLNGWWYNQMWRGVQVDEGARYRSNTDVFEPFELEFNLKELEFKNGRLEKVSLILTEFLLEFGYDYPFKFKPGVIKEYL